jgi:ribonuclease T2
MHVFLEPFRFCCAGTSNCIGQERKTGITPRAAGFLFCLLALTGICFGGQHRTERASGQPGAFDFYLLVLSWSPEFCYSHPSAAQCSKHIGFIVHGLWPQNRDGSYPLNCQTDKAGPANPSAVADIMPPEIIQHEWRTHGTCSGLSGDDYFALIRKIYEGIRIPDRLQASARSFTLSASQLKQEFGKANPNLNPSEMVVQLRGNYLNAVELCESKSLDPAPIPCSGLKDTRGGTFVVPAVR